METLLAIPIKCQFDTQEEDDGFYGVTYYFPDEYIEQNLPHYIAICRDEMEDPESLYIECDNQKNGFTTNQIAYSFHGNVLTLTLGEDSNYFFPWRKEKEFSIAFLLPAELEESKRIIPHIFNFKK